MTDQPLTDEERQRYATDGVPVPEGWTLGRVMDALRRKVASGNRESASRAAYLQEQERHRQEQERLDATAHMSEEAVAARQRAAIERQVLSTMVGSAPSPEEWLQGIDPNRRPSDPEREQRLRNAQWGGLDLVGNGTGGRDADGWMHTMTVVEMLADYWHGDQWRVTCQRCGRTAVIDGDDWRDRKIQSCQDLPVTDAVTSTESTPGAADTASDGVTA